MTAARLNHLQQRRRVAEQQAAPFDYPIAFLFIIISPDARSPERRKHPKNLDAAGQQVLPIAE